MSEVIEMPQNTVAAHQDHMPANSPMGMMMAAMQQGASLEQVEKMMDLQERWQKGEAKKAYDEAFAAFKAESIKIIKSEDVKDGPLRGKSYAKLHDWVNAVTPALSRHGLSSSWKLTKDEKDWIEVTCYLRHVGGHEESVSMGGPPDTGGAKNAIQARASSKSYLERYTLKAITGLSEQDDDNDGNVVVDPAIVDDWVAAAEGAGSIDELDQIWKDGLSQVEISDSIQFYNRFKTAVSASKKRLGES